MFFLIILIYFICEMNILNKFSNHLSVGMAESFIKDYMKKNNIKSMLISYDKDKIKVETSESVLKYVTENEFTEMKLKTLELFNELDRVKEVNQKLQNSILQK